MNRDDLSANPPTTRSGENIDGVIHEPIRLEHSDARRDLSVFFDHELHSTNGFMEGRIIEVKKDCNLGGGHVHGHSELFMIISGEATFTLYHEQHPDVQQVVTLTPGEKLKIPPYVAHSVKARKSTVLMAISERPYEQDSLHTRPAIESQ